MNDIKVGDKVYFFKYGNLLHTQTVQKITPTGIIKTQHHSMRYDRGFLHTIGGNNGWSSVSAKLETPELKKEYKNIILKRWIENNYKKIPLNVVAKLKDKYGE